jgi:hypothetical protein
MNSIRDNADLMDHILDQLEFEHQLNAAVDSYVDEQWEDSYTKITRTKDPKGWYYGVEVIRVKLLDKVCVASYSSDDRDEAVDTAERQADVYFEKEGRRMMGVR